jgi:hypothetical protein
VAHPLSRLRRRLGLALVTALVVLGAIVPGAQASLLPGLLPGILAPAGATGDCTGATKVFAPLGDDHDYMLIPGGTFEAGTAAWSGFGAFTTEGNEPFYVTSASDHRSLVLVSGVSVKTPPMCYDAGDPHLRLFVVNHGNPGAGLQVTVVVRSVLGVLQTLDGGTVYNDGTWQLSDPIRLSVSNLLGAVATDSITLKFTAVGLGGVWQIDDAYLDPSVQW